MENKPSSRNRRFILPTLTLLGFTKAWILVSVFSNGCLSPPITEVVNEINTCSSVLNFIIFGHRTGRHLQNGQRKNLFLLRPKILPSAWGPCRCHSGAEACIGDAYHELSFMVCKLFYCMKRFCWLIYWRPFWYTWYSIIRIWTLYLNLAVVSWDALYVTTTLLMDDWNITRIFPVSDCKPLTCTLTYFEFFPALFLLKCLAKEVDCKRECL